MTNHIIILLCSLSYLTAAFLQGLRLFGRQDIPQWFIGVLGFVAVGLHTWLLYRWIDVGFGQNLTFLNMLSLVAWLVAVFILLAAVRKPITNLFILIFPVAALSVLLVAKFPSHRIVNTAINPHELMHILLSTVAFSVMCIAALQALLLALQEWLLRRKPAAGILRFLPSLQTMESLLFEMILLGFILLSLVLITSIGFFHPLLEKTIVGKTLISIATWAVFAVLLAGHYYFGWRGQTAIRWTLGGVILLMLIYFGSNILAL